MGKLTQLLLPPGGRKFPGQRTIKISLRGVHTLCAGVLTGSYLVDAGDEAKAMWLLWTVGTGLGMLALDLLESVGFLAQVRGLVLMLKIGVVLSLPVLGAATGWALGSLMVIAVISSHAPSKVRYATWIGGGKITGGTSKG
ncbi:MAG: hypothetical protein P8N31_07545 [Planctomycetota bacterium]|nr:hypothetical protein [Planctomycetota bacterium]MDG2143392.1 hypothetical protein [Planctomycetota bacterium]